MLKEINKLGKILNRTEQQNINGGSGSCAAFVTCKIPGKHTDACGGGELIKNVSKEKAKSLVSSGGRWCCEGCNTASWFI